MKLDLSQTYQMIPIRPEDRFKTSFWLNDLAFEFNMLIPTIKSSHYHMQKFMNETFSMDIFLKFTALLSEDERKLLPSNFSDIMVTTPEEIYVFAENYEKLLVCLKLILMVARNEQIKFSIQNSSFLTDKLQIYGYNFDTMNADVTLDSLKSSAILNMKRPTSLFELQNRIIIFSYYSRCMPYLKHILYPLDYLIKTGKFKWTSIEEDAWTQAKEICALNVRLTVPDENDDLV